jgi:hypothetical protein
VIDGREKRIKEVAHSAKTAFEKFVVEPQWMGTNGGEILARAWRCSEPGSCNNAFTLYSVPGRLMIGGDQGFCAWERERDMIAWARGAIDSIDYFAEKVPREIKVKEYDPECVRAWIAENDKDVLEGEHEPDSKFVKIWIGELRRDLLEAVEGIHDERDVCQKIYDSGICDEVPDFDNFTYRFLWQRQSLKWFFKQLPQA